MKKKNTKGGLFIFKKPKAVEFLLKNPEICILSLPFSEFTMFHVVYFYQNKK